MNNAVEQQQERSWALWTEPEWIDVDGLPTAYRRGGSGEKVLYLHGSWGGTRSWLPFHSALAKSLDVIAPEHPGFGDTEAPARFRRIEDWILHYDGFLRALGDEPVHIVGHSLGALIAADLAIYYPERFKSVTLLNPIGLKPSDDDPFNDPFRWTPDESDEHLFNGRRDKVADQLVQQGSPEDDVQSYSEQGTVAVLLWNPRYDIALENRLGRIRAPFLSVGVDRDGVVGDAMAERFAANVPGGEFTRVTGSEGAPSSHMAIFDQPDDVAAAVVAHVRSHS